MNVERNVRFDLLPWLRRLWRPALFPLALQGMMLVAFALLLVNGLGHGTDLPSEALLTFRKTNLTTLAVWGLWWPAMIAVALAFGRVWCTVCPMELVNRVGDALARVRLLSRPSSKASSPSRRRWSICRWSAGSAWSSWPGWAGSGGAGRGRRRQRPCPPPARGWPPWDCSSARS